MLTYYIANRLSNDIGIIAKLKNIFDLKTRKNLYYHFIYPYFSYCWVWVFYVLPICLSCISFRNVLNYGFWVSKTYYSSDGLFKELKMLSIYDINNCSLCMFCYKFDFGLLPDIVDNFFTKVARVHWHHTRFQCISYVRALFMWINK